MGFLKVSPARPRQVPGQVRVRPHAALPWHGRCVTIPPAETACS